MEESLKITELRDEELTQVVGGDKTTNDGWTFSGYVAAKDAVNGAYYYAVCGQKWIYGTLLAKVSTSSWQTSLKFDVIEAHNTTFNIVSGSSWFLYTTRSKT